MQRKKQQRQQRRFSHWLRCQKRRVNQAWYYHCPCCPSEWLDEWDYEIRLAVEKWQKTRVFIEY